MHKAPKKTREVELEQLSHLVRDKLRRRNIKARLPAADITSTSKHTYFDIMWASHLLCWRVCCGRVCLWANSLVSAAALTREFIRHHKMTEVNSKFHVNFHDHAWT